MAFFQYLHLELTEAILDYVDSDTLQSTLLVARFLRFPSEKKLYLRVSLSDSSTVEGLVQRQVSFLSTVLHNDRLAQCVVKLLMGGCVPIQEGDPRINSILGPSMKKMVNLKQLEVFGYPFIIHAHLDSVPFSLAHLVISGEKNVEDEDQDRDRDLPILSILRAHPNLEELSLLFPALPPDLVQVLQSEQTRAIVSEEGIICAHLKRFDGYDDGLRLFLPTRMIEGVMATGSGVGNIGNDNLAEVWLTPPLIQSYQYLRVLEVWPDRQKDTCFLSTIASYLTSLTHLQIVDSPLKRITADTELVLTLERIPTLKSVTFTALLEEDWVPEATVQQRVELVCSACPEVTDIFVGSGEDPAEVMYHQYTKGVGFRIPLVGSEVACRQYAKWVHEP